MPTAKQIGYEAALSIFNYVEAMGLDAAYEYKKKYYSKKQIKEVHNLIKRKKIREMQMQEIK
jgi:hypothetical protein